MIFNDYVLDNLIEFINDDFDDNNFNHNNNVWNTKIINDLDNTHDRTVNDLSKYYYDYLLNNTTITMSYINNIIDLINNHNDITILNKQLILNYINHIIINNENIINFNCKELDFLLLCWNRTLIPENINNKYKLQMSILNNIIDCYSNEFDLLNFHVIKKLCCTSGRIMKILSSFVFIDVNPDLGSFISSNILKSEFLNKASLLFNDDISKTFYNNILNHIISDYDVKYHNQLYIFKNELINSIIFSDNDI